MNRAETADKESTRDPIFLLQTGHFMPSNVPMTSVNKGGTGVFTAFRVKETSLLS